jgi:YD repeat-containing protein
MHSRPLSTGLLSLAALLACRAPAGAEQILEIHNASLTSYVPASKSNIQDVRPLPEQRGVGLDGSARGLGGPPGQGGDPYPKCGKAAPVGPTNLPPGHDGGLVTPGDLFGPGGGGVDLGDAGGGAGLSAPPGVDTPTGAPAISDIDLAFPAAVPWMIGRSVNHAGRVEAQATVALSGNQSTSALTAHVDETDADPITAIDLGTVTRLGVSEYDESGTVLERSLSYFDVPASGAGTEGTNYDSTAYGSDDQGRRVRTKAPHGTITRSEHDSLGRVVGQWTGTNDKSWDGGETSATDNMVRTAESVYDGGNDKGNSHLTRQTL